MDELKSTTATVDELIDVLLDKIMRQKDLLQKLDVVACNCVPWYIRPTTMREIYEQRQASLERY